MRPVPPPPVVRLNGLREPTHHPDRTEAVRFSQPAARGASALTPDAYFQAERRAARNAGARASANEYQSSIAESLRTKAALCARAMWQLPSTGGTVSPSQRISTGILACLLAWPWAATSAGLFSDIANAAKTADEVKSAAPDGPNRVSNSVAPSGPSPSDQVWCVGADTRCPLPPGSPRGKKCWCSGTSN